MHSGIVEQEGHMLIAGHKVDSIVAHRPTAAHLVLIRESQPVSYICLAEHL